MSNLIDIERITAMPYYYDVMAPVVIICLGMLFIGVSYNLMRLFHVLTPTIAYAIEQLVKVIVQITKPKTVNRRTRNERVD